MIFQALQLALTTHGTDQRQFQHSLRVGLSQVTTDLMVVGFLHDVVEAGVALPDYFPSNIRSAVGFLTRSTGQNYDDYITRILTRSPDAVIVKRADLSDNLLHNPPPSLIPRYTLALWRLRPLPMSFPDFQSLVQHAEVVKFRLPLVGESEADYRLALSAHVRPMDMIEAHEIKTGKGWDEWTDAEKFDCLHG